MSNIVNPIFPSELQKVRLLNYLKCEECDRQFITLLDWLSKLKYSLDEYRERKELKPFEIAEEYENIATNTSKLLKLLDRLPDDHGLLDQVFKLTQIEAKNQPLEVYPHQIGLTEFKSLLTAFQIAANDMQHEIKPMNIKKPLETAAVTEMIRFAKLYDLPCGKRHTGFHDFLATVFELLNIDYENSFEWLIQKNKNA